MLIDCHVHAVMEKTIPRPNGDHFSTPDELIAQMDEAGIDMACVLPLISPEARQEMPSSEEVLKICALYPERLIPFCNVDPRADSHSANADLTRHFDFYTQAGCKGVGEVTANLYFDDPMVWNMLRHCADYNLPVIFHISPRLGYSYGLVDDLGLPRLERTLKQFPDLKLLGHSQAFWSEITGDITDSTRGGYPKGKVAPGGAVVRLFEEYENLYGDLSAGSGFNAISRDPEFGFPFLERFQDRLLFGTDICGPGQELPQPDWFRQALADGNISQEAYEKITWRNINDLLDLGLSG
ncbi:MAG: amidohydrolase family protein [Armatimonadetes bacterium]|nr:amidohydrolase family protein [Armatimonadota bacterium]